MTSASQLSQRHGVADSTMDRRGQSAKGSEQMAPSLIRRDAFLMSSMPHVGAIDGQNHDDAKSRTTVLKGHPATM